MTLTEARKALATQISDAELAGVTVYDHEPAQVTNGTSVTVSSGGFSPTEYLLSVRVYVSDGPPDTSQDQLDHTAALVDEVLAPAPRGDWRFSYDEDRFALVAFTTVEYPRDDF